MKTLVLFLRRGVQLFTEKRLPLRYQRVLRYRRYFSWFFPQQSLKLGLAMLRGDALRCGGVVLQMYGPQILADTLAACRALSLQPFLAWGTLLGHHREGGFIAYDRDIDLGLLESDFTRKNELIALMTTQGYVVRKDDPYIVSFHRTGFTAPHIDLQLFYQSNKQMVCATDPSQRREIYCYYFPLEIFSEFNEVSFLDQLSVLIPKNTELFLTTGYGDWRKRQKKWHYLDNPPNVVRKNKETL